MTSDPNPVVGIVMGSQSDWETMRHAAETLDALDSLALVLSQQWNAIKVSRFQK